VSKVYFISDLHLGHKRICEFSGPLRGDSTTVEEHDKFIVDQWNSVVTKNDLVWVLGDVCFDKAALPLLKQLKGSKHLVLGNHDEFTIQTYQLYFSKIVGFTKYKGLWLSHAPIHPDELRGKINVHGHVHSKSIPDPRYVNVSVEVLNGKPISFEEISQIQQPLP
jgi:calcineurin-like phosphoesterase family protein